MNNLLLTGHADDLGKRESARRLRQLPKDLQDDPSVTPQEITAMAQRYGDDVREAFLSRVHGIRDVTTGPLPPKLALLLERITEDELVSDQHLLERRHEDQ